MSSNKKNTKGAPPPTANGKPKQTSGPGTAAAATPKMNAWSKPLKTVTKPPARQNTPPARQNSSTPPPPPPPGYKAKDAGTHLAPLTTNGTANLTTPSDPPAGDGIQMSNLSPATLQQLRLAHRERALHIWLNLVGTKVILHLTDQSIVEGIFHTATPLPVAVPEQRNKYVLKAVRVLEQGSEHSETNIANGSTLVVDMSKVVQMHVKSLPKAATANGTQQPPSRNAFTDTEISGAKSTVTDHRDLQEAGTAWTSAPPPVMNNNSATMMNVNNNGSNKPVVLNSRAEALAGGSGGGLVPSSTTNGTDKTGLSGSIGGWDQFKANEALFNVKGSYDESMYTTQLDKKAFSANDIAKAERLAKEIEGTVATNWHMAEERNQKVEGDYDEEDLYSGVLPATTKATEAIATTTTTPPSVGAAMSYAKVAKASEEKEPSPSPLPTSKPEVVTPEPPEETPATKPEDAPALAGEAPAVAASEPLESDAQEEPEKKEEEKAATSDGDDNDKKDAPKSKLNANAKEFTLNINAPTFTPKFGGAPAPAAAAQPEAHPQHAQPSTSVDPNTGIPMHMPQGGGGAGPYMQQPQQGMMPMMAPQYVRYPAGPYPGMEHPQQPHPMHMQHITVPHHGLPTSSGRTSETASPIPADSGASTGGAGTGEDEDPMGGPGLDPDAAPTQQQPNPQSGPMPQQQQQQQQQTQQHPGMQQPMPYGMHPQQGYYNPQMGMPPRGPVPGYPQHMMPQQMPNPMYRQVYQIPGPHPGMMPQPMPYYSGPGSPMAYPGGYGYDDDMGYRRDSTGSNTGRGRGRGGRGRGRGGRGRGGERNAGGRGRYAPHHHYSHGGSGRNTPQQEDGGGVSRQYHHNHYHNHQQPQPHPDANEIQQSPPPPPPPETPE